MAKYVDGVRHAEHQTFLVTGVFQKEHFDNLALVVSQTNALKLIKELSQALSTSNEPSLLIDLHGKFDDDFNRFREIKHVKVIVSSEVKS